MATPVLPDSQFLIHRAEQCRSLASASLDPTLRDQMIATAGGYEELAKTAAKLTPLQSIKVKKLES